MIRALALTLLLSGCKVTYSGMDWQFSLINSFEFEEMHREPQGPRPPEMRYDDV